jgi:phage tail protein X
MHVMNIYRRCAATAAAVPTGLTGLVTPEAAASTSCTVRIHHDRTDVKIRNSADTTAQVALLPNGVRVTLPDAEAKAYAYFTAGGPLADVNAASYETVKYDTVDAAAVVLPAYQLGVDINGPADGGFTTLVYEPYLNAEGVKRTWTAPGPHPPPPALDCGGPPATSPASTPGPILPP